MSGAAFRLGTRLGRYPLLRWTIAALEQLVRMARLCVIVLMFVAAVTLAAYLITQFNYAPLWFESMTVVWTHSRKRPPSLKPFDTVRSV
jgi:hypothetical protein